MKDANISGADGGKSRIQIATANAERRDWWFLAPAWITSGIIHLVLLSLLVFVHGPPALEATPESEILETKVATEDVETDYNLENTDIGNDPNLPTNYDMPRLEDISVPGAVQLNDQVGVLNADTSIMPHTLPPPPGLGDNRGQGGGMDSGVFGGGNPLGFPGGMNGPLMMPGGFGGRSGATRERMVNEGGGNAKSEAAVARGLEWLARHQSEDGHWSLHGFMDGRCNCTGGGRNNDVAGTAFGLLPMLGAGQTHKGATGNNTGKYTRNVDRALKYLVLKQNSEGYFGGGMYAHGLASIAMCEAYGLTRDPALRKPAERAIVFIVKAQDNVGGGWRYEPRQAGDTSVVGWQVMALKSAQLAGIDVPSMAFERADKFLNSVASSDGGAYGYDRPPPEAQEKATAMTAVGLLCRQYMGWGRDRPELQAGIARIANAPARNSRSLYYTYYAAQVMHHMGGDPWKKWNEPMRDFLIEAQDAGNTPRRGHQRGSWDSRRDRFHRDGGRLMMTSLCILTLEVYYRHLPLYRRDILADKN
jgi:hypothetical protein